MLLISYSPCGAARAGAATASGTAQPFFHVLPDGFDLGNRHHHHLAGAGSPFTATSAGVSEWVSE